MAQKEAERAVLVVDDAGRHAAGIDRRVAGKDRQVVAQEPEPRFSAKAKRAALQLMASS